MAAREIDRSDSFARSLEQLSKKHPELKGAVADLLKQAANSGPCRRAHKIPGLDGHPVFKERLRLRNQGQRGAARIIYFCDRHRVFALFLFVKSDQGYVPEKEMRDALNSAGLRERAESSHRPGTPRVEE